LQKNFLKRWIQTPKPLRCSREILGVVFLAGKNVNLEMIKSGYAEVYRGSPATGFDSAPYWKAEEEARAAKKGMWTQGETYVSPREWRRVNSGN
jgi:endonuclease YncB( thermonuclease family)